MIRNKASILRKIAKEHEKSWGKIISKLPRALRESGINLHKYIGTKNSWIKIYPKFCDEVLERFPDHTYVFIDRDARPLYITMEHFREARNLDLENRLITFNREMRPKAYVEKMEEAKPDFDKMKKAAADFLKKRRYDKTLLNDYLRQELGDAKRLLFIDTGFWGTCVLYAQEFFHKKQTDHMQVVGIEGSNCQIKDQDEENITQMMEHRIDHGFEIRRLRRKEGIVTVETYPLELFEKEHRRKSCVADYIAVEMNALEYLHGKVDDHMIRKVLEKYTSCPI